MTQEEFNQLMQSKEEFKVILYTDSSVVGLCYKFDTFGELVDLIKNQNEEKLNYCHHEVDLSSCSEEYRKAYYDGWNNCNMQHSQCELEKSDVLKCLINGMKFYYGNNEEATWGTLKFSMKVKDILFWLEKQGERKSLNDVAKEITKNKEAATSFLKSCGIMNTNGELADEYKIEQDEQRPAKWSVEDEACVILLDSICESSEAEYYDHPDSIIRKEIVNARHWLKSLESRVQSQPVWSKEDEKTCNKILNYFTCNSDTSASWIVWISSIRRRLKGE